MRHLICSVPLVVLLGCAGTVEVEGDWSPEVGDPYGDSEPLTDDPHMRLVNGFGSDEAYFTVELLQTDGVDGIYDGWCGNASAASPGTGLRPVVLHWSTEPIPDGLITQTNNLDLLNYILNTYELGDMVPIELYGDGSLEPGPLQAFHLQEVVWALLHNADGDPDPGWAPASLLVAEARAEGEGFLPGCGGIEVVLAVPLDNLDSGSQNDVQPVAVEVPVPPSHCR